MKLTAGTRACMQLHYHPSATGGTDQTQLGIYFAKGDVDKIVRQEFLPQHLLHHSAGQLQLPRASLHPHRARRQPARVSVLPHYAPPGPKDAGKRRLYADGQRDSDDPDRRLELRLSGDLSVSSTDRLPGAADFGFTATFDNSVTMRGNPNSPPAGKLGNSTRMKCRAGPRVTQWYGAFIAAAHQRQQHREFGQLCGEVSAPGTVVTLFGTGTGIVVGIGIVVAAPRTLSNGSGHGGRDRRAAVSTRRLRRSISRYVR